jgi:hypothetical protein
VLGRKHRVLVAVDDAVAKGLARVGAGEQRGLVLGQRVQALLKNVLHRKQAEEKGIAG